MARPCPSTTTSEPHMRLAATPRRNSTSNGGRSAVASFMKVSQTTNEPVPASIAATPLRFEVLRIWASLARVLAVTNGLATRKAAASALIPEPGGGATREMAGGGPRNGRVPRLQRSPREGPESRVLTRSATPPADLISARLFRTLRSVAMQFYSHLSDDDRDQIAILGRARGGDRWGVIARALGRAKTTISRGAAAERTPLGRVFSASRRRSLPSAPAA